MNTPLDDWKAALKSQQALERFWLSADGQLLQRTLEYLGRPKASAVSGTGTEAAIAGGLLYQQSAGHFALLELIPTLFPEPIAELKTQTDARERLKPKTLQRPS